MKGGVVPNQIVNRSAADGWQDLNYAFFVGRRRCLVRTRLGRKPVTAVIQQSRNSMKLFQAQEALGKVYAMTSTKSTLHFPLTNSWSLLSGAAGGVRNVSLFLT